MSEETQKIVLIEFNVDSVYIQYENYDSDTLSYSKAKSIFKDLQYKIRYSTSESTKAIDFVNNISRRKYLVDKGTIEPKPYVPAPINGKGKKRY